MWSAAASKQIMSKNHANPGYCRNMLKAAYLQQGKMFA
jgi:hypothetical protein